MKECPCSLFGGFKFDGDCPVPMLTPRCTGTEKGGAGEVSPRIVQKEAAVKRTRFLGMLALIAALLVAGIAQAVEVSIESWDDGLQELWVNYADQQTDSESMDTDASLGGERDIYLEWLSGTTGAIHATVDYGGTSDRFSYSAADGMMGRVTLQWDGDDDDPINLDNDGLSDSNVDLTDDGNNDSIHVVILAEDLRATLEFRVYADTTALNWSSTTVDLVGINPGTRADIIFPFSSFGTGGGTGADFADVGAIVMILYGDIDQSVDVSIDFAQTDNAREYGDLPLNSPPYGTSILSANHIPQGLRLGVNCDADSTYNASTYAAGDDTNDVDDEDGLVPASLPWTAGDKERLRITVDGCLDQEYGCYVNGWIDWNGDGDFNDTEGGALEKILDNELFFDGTTYTPSFDTPTSLSGDYYARFRICETSTACDSPDNTDTNVLNGEVEDYHWPLGPDAVKLTSFAARPAAGGVLLTWETASEHDNAGFNLYRSASLADIGQQLNAALIPSQSLGGDLGASYEFLDSTTLPGVIYYTLEDVDFSGVRTPHGPISFTLWRVYLPVVRR